MKKFLTLLTLIASASAFSAELLPTKATAGHHDKDHVAANSIDGNLGTRWATNKNPGWVQFEFKEPSEISSIEVAAFKSNERRQKFEVEYSLDGSNWTKLFDAETQLTPKDKQFEKFTFKPVKAKYVKFVVKGTDTSKTWSAFYEVQFNSEVKPAFTVTK